MTKRKKSNRLIWILLGVVVLMVAGLAMFGEREVPGKKVLVEPAATHDITETVSASGKIYPEFEVKISSDVSGEIVQLTVEEGDSVKAGQLLVRVRPESYQAQVERLQANVDASNAQVANSKANVSQLEAQILQMQAQVKAAELNHNRNIKLKKDGVISQADFDNTEVALETAKANLQSSRASLEGSKQSVRAAEFNLKSAKASVKEANENLTRTSIYAPTSGIVSLLNVEKGERVVGTSQMTGTEIMRIANMNVMEVQVDVSENDVNRVSIGDEADIEVDAYLDRKFGGKVTEIANSSQTVSSTTSTDQVTNFTVTIRIDNTSYKDLAKKLRFPFRPGMSASVDIKTHTESDVLAVKIESVTVRDKEGKKTDDFDELNEVVFVSQGDTVIMKKVKTGIQDDKHIQILKGLAKGDEIVSKPYEEIKEMKEGDKIQKVEEDELYRKKGE